MRSPALAVPPRHCRPVCPLVRGLVPALLLLALGCDEGLQAPATAPEVPAGDSNLAAAAGDVWTVKAKMRTGRAWANAVALNGRIHVVGGRNSASSPTATHQVYDIATNVWSPRAPMPGARSDGNGASVLGGRIYIAGGRNKNAFARTRTLFVYTPATDTWERKADMPQAGGCGAQGVIAGKLYVYAACVDVDNVGHEFFRYDPATNRWATLVPPPTRHGTPASGVIGAKFYLAGGNVSFSVPNRALHVYDPASNSWSARASMPKEQIIGPVGGVIDGKLYVAGGEDAEHQATSLLQVFDPATNTWAERAAMPTAHYATTGAVAGGMLFVIGGWGSNGPPSAIRANEAYDP